ncbi:MAG: MMPL family transporter [Bacteroidales bacterium]|nr:MMPL family transporter [Bacteroidales bacterium]
MNDYGITGSGTTPLGSYSSLDTGRGRELMSYFVSEDGMNIRTTIRTALLNDREEIILLDEIEAIFRDSFNGTGVKLYVTGMATVFAHLSSRLVESQVRSFSFTFIVIFFMFLLLFRSIRMAMICMLPNILPVLCTLGIMGIANIQLDVATILIATVSFGIAVDDTIHFAVTYKEFLIGSDKMGAVNNTLVSVGRPLVITSLLLTVGFLSMIFSSYRPIVFMGLFLSLNIILALLCDLILLPAILFYGTKYKDTNL